MRDHGIGIKEDFPAWSLRADTLLPQASLSSQARAYLHQKLIAWDSLHRLDHEVGQRLLFLVLTHALLKPKAELREFSHED